MTRKEEIDIIAEALIPLLRTPPPTAKSIKDAVEGPLLKLICQQQGYLPLESSEKDSLYKDLVDRLVHVKNLVTKIFTAKDYKPWLAYAKEQKEFGFFFWKEYQWHLVKDAKFDVDTVTSIDDVTDKIIDHAGDPRIEDKWARRGMVVGQVQSGKTANYIGTMCKAADCGYRVIIVLAGLSNVLRSQTQKRVDEGFVGQSFVEVETEKKEKDIKAETVGVGFTSGKRPLSVVSLTTLQSDFTAKTASHITSTIGTADNTIYVAVIKKNVASLKAIAKWMDTTMSHRPLLLIDDEADNASVNYNDQENTPTTINKLIRNLLHKFQHSAYVGYTATPFANIFIDPDVASAAYGEDLFPKDFIIALDDEPPRYVGPKRIFGAEVKDEDKILRVISDSESFLPLKHKKTFVPSELPPSLKEAIRIFVIAHAVRLCRGQTDCHCSMMVNASRFIDVQNRIAILIENEWTKIANAIKVYGALAPEENGEIKTLYDLYVREYASTGFAWDQIKKQLEKAVDVEIIQVNMASEAKEINFSRKSYPNGRKLIAVGGYSLSRGLTLEGLCVSYFLRNSQMYDTLMQMGRWFGYRIGYHDLCRIYLSGEAQSWYRHITLALQELWDEFDEMEKSSLTPSEFGLRVLAHPLNLIVTAKNKMRNAQTIVVKVDLTGKLIETTNIPISSLGDNLIAVDKFIKKLGIANGNSLPCSGKFWTNVPYKEVCDLVTEFKRSEINMETAARPVCAYLKKLADAGIDKCDVYLVSSEKKDACEDTIGGMSIKCEERTVEVRETNLAINSSNRRVGTAGQERCGLAQLMTSDMYLAAAKEYLETHNSLPGSFFRRFRTRPLLIIHLLKALPQAGKQLPPNVQKIAAWGLSFPSLKGAGTEDNSVEYVLNPVALRQWFEDDDEDEDMKAIVKGKMS